MNSVIDKINDVFSSPIYRISPYTTYSDSFNIMLDSAPNHSLVSENIDYLEKFCASGRSALSLALDAAKLSFDDEVLIITSSGSRYVSSCVTNTIESYCKHSRLPSAKTKCVVVIHEFGKFCNFDRTDFPLHWVIIEDYAHSFWGLKKQNLFQGDFIVFSLSKFLDIKNGGLLLYRKRYEKISKLNDCGISRNVFYNNSDNLDNIFNAKNELKSHYERFFNNFSEGSFFEFEEYECPGVYLFKINLPQDILHKIKVKLQNNFIECSVFYGEAAFFLPCNFNMKKNDVEYISKIFKVAIKDSLL